ncbi:MAG TPA: AI-2E family transporter [Chiayiivirga sp.]|nr:AI-2E family transporter [Chiayiivirga sp.]
MSDTHKWQLAALIAAFGLLLWLLGPVLTPFVIAALLAYVGDPLVDRLERLRLSRSGAVAIVFALMTLALVGVVLLLIPMLERQISTMIEQFPRYRDWFTGTALPWISARIGVDIEGIELDNVFAMLKQHWQQAGGVAATLWGGISKSGLVILNWVVNLALIPVVAFYLLRDWDVMVEKIRLLIPRPIEPVAVRLARESDSVLAGFLRGQLSVMLALGTIYWLGLWMVGIELALLIGMIAGLVSFIPYLGAIVGIGIGLIAALVQFGDWTHVVLVCVVFGVGQMLESIALTPWLVGDRIGMHPVAVIFAVMAGGQVFGFIGVLVALPVAAVVMVLLRYLYERYTASRLYGAEPAPSGSPAEPAVELPADIEAPTVLAATAPLAPIDQPVDAPMRPRSNGP